MHPAGRTCDKAFLLIQETVPLSAAAVIAGRRVIYTHSVTKVWAG